MYACALGPIVHLHRSIIEQFAERSMATALHKHLRPRSERRGSLVPVVAAPTVTLDDNRKSLKHSSSDPSSSAPPTDATDGDALLPTKGVLRRNASEGGGGGAGGAGGGDGATRTDSKGMTRDFLAEILHFDANNDLHHVTAALTLGTRPLRWQHRCRKAFVLWEERVVVGRRGRIKCRCMYRLCHRWRIWNGTRR